MSIATKTFKVQPHELNPEEHQPRSARRVILNADILKNFKLATGDVVAVLKDGAAVRLAQQPSSIAL